MKSEKSKVLGVLLPSESCHDKFEALYLQYSYDMAVGVLTRRSGSQLVMLRVSSSQMLMQEATQ